MNKIKRIDVDEETNATILVLEVDGIEVYIDKMEFTEEKDPQLEVKYTSEQELSEGQIQCIMDQIVELIEESVK